MRVSKGGLGTHTNSIDPSVESVLNCALGADRIHQHVKLRNTRNDQILVSAVWYQMDKTPCPFSLPLCLSASVYLLLSLLSFPSCLVAASAILAVYEGGVGGGERWAGRPP
eukprot:COSAG03_NODE_953_length_5213_cov_30.480055_4_plen_111_part_00